MKRFTSFVFAALLGTGALAAPAAMARDVDVRVWTSSRDHVDPAWRYDRRDSRSERRWRRDPVFRALRRSNRVLLNNYYQGGRYLTARRWYGPDAIRFIGMNPDGTYNIWFRGDTYRGYSRFHNDQRILYLGSAPTRPGFRFEIVLD